MLFIKGILNELGITSEVFAEHVGQGLEGKVHPHTEYRPDPNQRLLVHHSMGHNVEDWLLGLPEEKTLIYHNITPEWYFKDEGKRNYIRLGQRQLETLLQYVKSAIAMSDYNLRDLRTLRRLQTDVIPLLFDTSQVRKAPFTIDIARRRGDSFRILFVGRILPHKCQDELIELCSHLRTLSKEPFELVLIGAEVLPEYSEELRKLVAKLGLQNYVRILGKVSQNDLYGWYRASDAFVCFSEHEGFGVPLIESMIFDLPVFAASSTAIPTTLGEAGVLFPNKRDLGLIAETLLYVRRNRSVRNCILRRQRQRINAFSRQTLAERLIEHLGLKDSISTASLSKQKRLNPKIQIEGPAETSYSLAIVNRQIAYALNKYGSFDVTVFLTEGPGEYKPDQKALKRLRSLKLLAKRGQEFSAPEVTLRNLYPPRVRDCDGLINGLCFAWEETAVPSDWVEDFNKHLDCIFASSRFTRRALVDSGVRIPVFVYGHGAEHINTKKTGIPNLAKRKFRFLHISSCFPRKGPDVLLNAFAKAFEPEDNVELLLKTFSNPHHSVADDISTLRTTNGKQPLVTLIEDDLPEEGISGLYEACDCLVMPSRGEGFGLPLVEAFKHEKPVVTTGFGGQTDFCDAKTAWLIPYRLRPAKTHLSEPGSLWAEPDTQALTEILKKIVRSRKRTRQTKARAGFQLAERELTWKQSVAKICKGIDTIRSQAPIYPDQIRIAWITTWNMHCGISAYSKFLLSQPILAECGIRIYSNTSEGPFLENPDPSHRCWTQDFISPRQTGLSETVIADNPSIVVIQFNFGFFSVKALAQLIRDFVRRSIGVIIDFHSTADVDKPDLKTSLSKIKRELGLCHRLLVHNLSDIDRFQSYGLLGNTTFFPHGVTPSAKSCKVKLKESLGLPVDSPLIATFGFLLPHKGILELIYAYKILRGAVPNARLLLLNARHVDPLSRSYEHELNEVIEKERLVNSIIQIHDFLPDEQIQILLEASEITVFPYQKTQESVSGAIRYALSAHSAAVCTPVPIFEDLRDTAYMTADNTPEAIADALRELLQNRNIYHNQLQIQQRWMSANSWERCATKLRAIIQEYVTTEAQ